MSAAPQPEPALPPSAPPAHALTLRVGFAGHRTTDADALAAALAQAFAIAAQAAGQVAARPIRTGETETVAQAHAAIWPGAAPGPGLSLLVGQAPGADAVATAQWRAGGHGAVHALFPHADPDEPERFAWTDDPGKDDAPPRTALPAAGATGGPFERFTVLDGRETAAIRNAHLEQARWLVRWSDIVVVAWNGEAAGGPGGTADTVALALKKNLPVIWIETAPVDGAPAMTPRFLKPDTLRPDNQFSELVEALETPSRRDLLAPPATADALAAALLETLRPPSAPAPDESEAGHGHDEADRDEQTQGRRVHAEPDWLSPPAWTGWSAAPAYALGRWRAETAKRLADRWAWFYRSLTPATHAGAGHPPAAPPVAPTPPPAPAHALILAAFADADRRSTVYGNLHRAMQMVLLITAVLAVLAGTSPALSASIKWLAVFVEFVLLGGALAIWSLFQLNHRHWSDTRRLAERLRAMAATWPLGFDFSDMAADQPRTWTEWQARAILRAAGPPVGVMSAARVDAALEGAFAHPDGLVAGQGAYNHSRHGRMHALHAGLARIEKWSFGGLLVLLGLFVVIYPLVYLPGWIGNLLLILSALVPTVAAACLALDAKLGIEESAHKARRLEADFAALRERYEAADDTPQKLLILRAAANLLMTDVDSWRDAAVRRRIATL